MAQRLPSGSGHIIDHLNVELLLYIHVLFGFVKGIVKLYSYQKGFNLAFKVAIIVLDKYIYKHILKHFIFIIIFNLKKCGSYPLQFTK